MELPDTLPPCRFCGNHTFIASPNVAILWDVRKGYTWPTEGPTGERDRNWGSGESTFKTGFRGGALVCRQCGHMELFMANVHEWVRALGKYPWREVEVS